MPSLILLIHVSFGLLFVLFVLIQDKGTGLSATFGGTGTFYASQRGAAKVVHYLTVVFAVIFFASALFFVVLPKPVPGLEVTPLTEGTTVDPGAVQVETEPK
jgi:protein translocase SecG subunit